MRNELPFDASTGDGQKRLFYVAMGHDITEAPVRRQAPEAPAPRTPAAPAHPLVGKMVRATWMPGRPLEGTSVGRVIDAVPVAYSDRFRLSILTNEAEQLTQRAYTDDPDWNIVVLDGAGKPAPVLP